MKHVIEQIKRGHKLWQLPSLRAAYAAGAIDSAKTLGQITAAQGVDLYAEYVQPYI